MAGVAALATALLAACGTQAPEATDDCRWFKPGTSSGNCADPQPGSPGAIPVLDEFRLVGYREIRFGNGRTSAVRFGERGPQDPWEVAAPVNYRSFTWESR